MTSPALHGPLAAIAALPQPDLKTIFTAEPDRLSSLVLSQGPLRFDWSKTHLTGELIDAFLTLAQEQGFAAQRDALFAGEAVNNTEGRAAEHPAERGEAGCAGVLQRSHFHASRQCHCQRGDSGGPDRGGAEHLFPILRPL